MPRLLSLAYLLMAWPLVAMAFDQPAPEASGPIGHHGGDRIADEAEARLISGAPELDVAVAFRRFRILERLTAVWEREGAALKLRSDVPEPHDEPPAPDQEAKAPEPEESVIPDIPFEEMVFSDGQGIEGLRKRLTVVLRKRLDEIGQMVSLTKLQTRKLELAGRGDIERLIEVVEAIGDDYEQAKKNIERLRELKQNLTLVEARIQTGLFGESSLLGKTLQKMINDKQLTPRSSGRT